MAMANLISAFKRLKIKEDPAGLKPQSPWRNSERIVQGKFVKYRKGTDVQIPLSNPENVEPILARADKKEIPGILMKVIDDIHQDRMRGKRLVKEAIQNARSPAIVNQLSKIADPVSVTKTNTPARGWNDKTEVIETRELNRQELAQARIDYRQGNMSDADYMVHLYQGGARSLRLNNEELGQLALTPENPNLHDALQVVQESVIGTFSLWTWMCMAWRHAFPIIDLEQFQDKVRWQTPEEGLKMVKKIGTLLCIYDDHADHPLRHPLNKTLKRLILRGAPSTLQFSLQTAMSTYNSLSDVYQFLKDCRELQQKPKLTFQVSQGLPRPLVRVDSRARSTRWNPFYRIQPNRTSGRQGNFLQNRYRTPTTQQPFSEIRRAKNGLGVQRSGQTWHPKLVSGRFRGQNQSPPRPNLPPTVRTSHPQPRSNYRINNQRWNLQNRLQPSRSTQVNYRS